MIGWTFYSCVSQLLLARAAECIVLPLFKHTSFINWCELHQVFMCLWICILTTFCFLYRFELEISSKARLVQYSKPSAVCCSSVSGSICSLSVMKGRVTHMHISRSRERAGTWLKGWAGSEGFAGALFNRRGWAISRIMLIWLRWRNVGKTWRLDGAG